MTGVAQKNARIEVMLSPLGSKFAVVDLLRWTLAYRRD
jgi:hypothetical protein